MSLGMTRISATITGSTRVWVTTTSGESSDPAGSVTTNAGRAGAGKAAAAFWDGLLGGAPTGVNSVSAKSQRPAVTGKMRFEPAPMTGRAHERYTPAMSDVPYNRIWLDGVELVDVHSGDVSAAEADLRRIIDQGGGWFTFPFERGHYTIHASKDSTVIALYVS